MSEPIHFYSTQGEFGFLSNFYASKFKLRGKIWRTTEHYFQAQKFAGTPSEEEIRSLASPMAAARAGRSRRRPLRRDWESVKDDVMQEALRAKFEQNAELGEALLETAGCPLVEHTPRDSYWGDGGDGSGKNRLGILLMELRSELATGVNHG